ncbi:bifunctional hydroxymethylpyrimidine kinase/phosphomethylpyrimidine kinase [Swingsia samuiensis]|uniref:hydroxymethylpyrimidine kinase n=1 Tax=Swingsia samuiensis TaxID=1293412 RepID=A0A4Y6ULF5_9PROT|nr:bifunctional hydroxymethylpyrimidine kinase/phosphomethylpyrimidine kinase [Swingsia samuiensis]QDH17296.1 bifunctional hydroxymethylpyrimidine kinase/phosphomethylpyrimidine kinase [Swingsia samuiensis]
MHGRVLTIAGSDSGGGAGIQADLKTITALGGFGMSAITALTAQNTVEVKEVHTVPVSFIRKQIQAVVTDLGVDCFKTGMLASAEIVHAVADELDNWKGIPLVLDPVMVSTSGSSLLAPDAISAVIERLLPRSTIVTPNIPEAEMMTGIEIKTLSDMRRAAAILQQKGANSVLLKGGHLESDTLIDLLVLKNGTEIVLTSTKIKTRHTHGTGCTLASAIAVGVAQGYAAEKAVRRGSDYLRQALLNAPGYGHGHGPVDHGVTVQEYWKTIK